MNEEEKMTRYCKVKECNKEPREGQGGLAQIKNVSWD